MEIKERENYEIGLKHGNDLTVTTTGTAIVSQYVAGVLTGDVLNVTPTTPVTVGPLFVDSQWRIDSLTGTATATKGTDGKICRVIITTDALLPTYGKTGLIYETESGWSRWDEVTGAYIDPTVATVTGVKTVNAATYSLLVADSILNVTYSATGACTITIPTAQITDGRIITIKDAGGDATTNNITIATEGAETIDGEATAVISTSYNALTLYSDGSNLFII